MLYTHADAQRGIDAPVHAVQVVCAHVLAGVGGHGRADALQRDGEELRCLAAGCLRGHDVAAQTIDGTLQHDAADGRDAALQAHGDAHAAELERSASGAELPLFSGPAQLPVMFEPI